MGSSENTGFIFRLSLPWECVRAHTHTYIHVHVANVINYSY